ncbi:MULTISPECIES: putative aminohydrolase SsnA [Clostridium]|jgi:putative selenium metabolism protein SsnA|uniref:Putative aminohydrolase SsnA n=1 Tax=bioreactor metagenome TaxID=1076179 RepID=A0A644WRL7_9ZZZZ|nr:putative aminohydrolase SsnA [Clostridium sp. C8]KLE15444.1 chlorohydrolase [Clostridium sp. C8]
MILVGNGIVITQDNNNPIINNGAIVIKDNIIVEVGDYNALKSKYNNYEFVDAKGKVIMPGIINNHHHIYSAFARGMDNKEAPSNNFVEILERLWWKMDKKLTLEDTKYSAYTTYIDCIKNGVTTVFDHHASPYSITDSLFTIGDVAKELGMRTTLCYEVSDRDGVDITNEGIYENVNFIKYANKDDSDMIKGLFGLHASFTLSNKTLEKCAKEMEGLNTGYHVHAAEGIADLHDTLKVSGKRVIERLNDYNILGDKTLAVHCIHINDNEMGLLKSTNTNVINNPESNMGNAVGCSPVLEMLNKGVTVGMGTDGYTSDMFESMKVFPIIQRHNRCHPGVAFNETFKLLFENNKIIADKYFNREVGVLKEGAYADIIVLDYNPITPMNANNLHGHMLFGFTGRSVITTIINGKIIMKDREMLNIDEEKIFRKSRELAQKLWEKM